METEKIILDPFTHLSKSIKSVLGVDLKKARTRKRNVVNARMIYSYILHTKGWTYSSIARSLNKNHATIIHYVKNFNHYLMSDPELRKTYTLILNTFSEDLSDLFYLSEDELKKELILLREQNKILSLRVVELEDDLNSALSRNERLKDIYKVIEERTKVGQEEEMMWSINRLYNGI